GFRVVREFVFGRVLRKVDARQTGENEGSGVGFEFQFRVDFDFANRFERFREGVKCGEQIGAATELKFFYRALAVVEDDSGDMVFDFGGVLLHVGERAAEALFFAGPENKAQRATGTRSAFDDGVGSGENCSNADTIVGCAFAEIPGIEVPADHNNLLGMFTAGNFADDVGAFDGTTCEFVLNVDVNTNGFALGEIAVDLSLVFATGGEARSFDINAEAEDPRVGEVHAFGLEAEITANDGNCTCLIDAPKKFRILAEHLPEILLGRALSN